MLQAKGLKGKAEKITRIPRNEPHKPAVRAHKMPLSVHGAGVRQEVTSLEPYPHIHRIILYKKLFSVCEVS